MRCGEYDFPKLNRNEVTVVLDLEKKDITGDFNRATQAAVRALFLAMGHPGWFWVGNKRRYTKLDIKTRITMYLCDNCYDYDPKYDFPKYVTMKFIVGDLSRIVYDFSGFKNPEFETHFRRNNPAPIIPKIDVTES